MVTIKAGQLAELVRDVFAKAGCSAAEAERIGKYLVSANLTGHDSHGVARVPRYLQWKRDGVVHADRKVKVVSETPVLAVVDGLHGFGQTVTPQAVAIGIEKCKAMGLSMVALRTPATSAGSATGQRWRPRRASSRCISSMPRAACWWRPSAAPSAGFSTAPFCVGVPRPGPAGGARFRHLAGGRGQGAGGEQRRQAAAQAMR